MVNGHQQELCSLNIICQTVSNEYSKNNKRINIKIFRSQLQNSSQCVNIRVTDENDPEFLYLSQITAEDYPFLKQSQGLLVDFSAFPGKLVDLLQICCKEQTESIPKYSLCLNERTELSSTVHLEVIESNPFKRLCHLSINLVAASPHDKLNFMIDCVNKLKNISDRKDDEFARRFRSLEEQLESSKRELSNTKRTLLAAEEAHSHQINTIQRENEKKINEYRQKILTVQSDSDRRIQRINSEVENKLTSRTALAQQKVDSLVAELRTVSEMRSSMEKGNRELRSHLSSSEQRCEELKRDLSQVSAVHDKLKELNIVSTQREQNLKISFDNLMDENKKTHRALEQAMAHLREYKNRLSEVEEMKDLALAKCTKRETSAKNLFIELQNTMETVKKLQIYNSEIEAEMKSIRENKEKMNEQIQEQSELIKKNKTEIEGLANDLDERKKYNEGLEAEVDNLKKTLTVESNKIVTKDNMIDWLNKRLSESEKCTALVQASPLTGAYLPPKNISAERYKLCSEVEVSTSNTVEVAALNQLTKQQTSTPLVEMHSNSTDSLRRVAFANSLSAVQTPPNPKTSEVTSNKENSNRYGLSSEYLTATAKGVTSLHKLEGRSAVPDKVVKVVHSDADPVEIIAGGDAKKGGLLRYNAKTATKWKF